MSRPMFVGMQGGFPFVWVQVYDTEEETEELKLETIATGQRLYNTWSRHVGSFLVDDGEFVWHVFEVLNEHKEKDKGLS